MNISINTALNITSLLSGIFEEMKSPYWSLSYDPFVVNAFKLMVNYNVCSKTHYTLGDSPYTTCIVNIDHNGRIIETTPQDPRYNVMDRLFRKDVPYGIHLQKLTDGICYHTRGQGNYKRKIYHILVYDMNVNVTTWLSRIYPFVSDDLYDQVNLFDIMDSDCKMMINTKLISPREYLTKGWLNSLINNTYKEPYRFELSINRYKDLVKKKRRVRPERWCHRYDTDREEAVVNKLYRV